jgi:hypothetical protein
MAMSAAVCDGLQVYYNYMTFACGIPEIRVTGTVQDWNKIIRSISVISDHFRNVPDPAFEEWLGDCADIVFHIKEDLANDRPQIEWWQDIFTSRNVGSGGELEISGWITKLYYRKCSSPKLEIFPTTLSVVPYVNEDSGRQFVGLHGALKTIRTEDGFVRSGYGHVIFEKTQVEAKDEPLGKTRLTVENVKVKMPSVKRTLPTLTGPITFHRGEMQHMVMIDELGFAEVTPERTKVLEACMLAEEKIALEFKGETDFSTPVPNTGLAEPFCISTKAVPEPRILTPEELLNLMQESKGDDDES